MHWCFMCGGTDIAQTATGHSWCRSCGYLHVEDPPKAEPPYKDLAKRERLREAGD